MAPRLISWGLVSSIQLVVYCLISLVDFRGTFYALMCSLLWRVRTGMEMAGSSVVFSPQTGLRYQGFSSFRFFMLQSDCIMCIFLRAWLGEKVGGGQCV